MNLQCQACGHQVRLSDENATKFAGKRVKCPSCKEPMAVPAAAPSKPSSSGPISAKPPAARAPAAAPAPARHLGPAAAKPAESPFPSFDSPSSSSGIGTISAGDDPRSPNSRLKKPKKSSVPLGVILGAGGAVAALAMVVVALVVMNQSSVDPARDPTAALDPAGPSNLKVSGKGELSLKWPEAERKDAVIYLDGTKMELPASGPISYLIASGQHKLVIVRRNYDQVEAQIFVPEKQNIDFTPTWKQLVVGGIAGGNNGFRGTENVAAGGYNPNANFNDWKQDFDKAKAAAANSHKDVLLLFNGSDWCPPCKQLAREIVFDTRFNTLVASEYELVFVDFPKSSTAQGKVENAARNNQLQLQFGIESYPTVMLTDAEGLPYAKLGYTEGGLPKFLEQIEAAQSIRQLRDDLARAVEEGSWNQRMAYAEEFLGRLSQQDLQWFYSDKYQQWFDAARQADAKNQLGYNEHFFQFIWLARLHENRRMENEAGMRTVVKELDKWKEKYEFRNTERAAKLHLAAAMIMYELSDPEGVNHFASAGVEYSPSDEDVADALSALSTMGDSINVLGNGTGFVIAEGGYIMTNHHVIEGGGKLAVRLPGVEDLVPCKVVAKNEEHDLALVKVDHEAMKALTPLKLTLLPPELANKICVLGYPLSDSLGNQIKFTSGEVAATADLQRNGMILLDCTVNPGNSGGPLLNSNGDVIGVVTAKSVSRDGSEDTYGMAGTAQRAVEFLQQHLPGYQPPAAATPTDVENLPPTANWTAVVREVKGSVLQIVILRD